MAVVSFKHDRRISSEHRAFLREFCHSLGGDLDKLANRLGLKIFYVELPLDEDAGLIFDPSLGSDSGYSILVNAHMPIGRQKFTIAHEIGHFVLHRNEPEFLSVMNGTPRVVKSHFSDNIIQLPVARRSSSVFSESDAGFRVNHLSRKLERQADDFAVSLLMPAGPIKRTPEFSSGQPVALARRLRLSVGAMIRRFEELEFEPEF